MDGVSSCIVCGSAGCNSYLQDVAVIMSLETGKSAVHQLKTQSAPLAKVTLAEETIVMKPVQISVEASKNVTMTLSSIIEMDLKE